MDTKSQCLRLHSEPYIHFEPVLNLTLFLDFFRVQIRYAEDCKSQYGRLLGGHHIEPSKLAEATKKTQDLWKQHYPSEAYCLPLPWTPQPGAEDELGTRERCLEYDLTSAVIRQSSFYYQVCSWLFFSGNLEGRGGEHLTSLEGFNVLIYVTVCTRPQNVLEASFCLMVHRIQVRCKIT